MAVISDKIYDHTALQQYYYLLGGDPTFVNIKRFLEAFKPFSDHSRIWRSNILALRQRLTKKPLKYSFANAVVN